MEKNLVEELKSLVKEKYDGNVRLHFEGNGPVLPPEDVIVDVEDGITRFAGERMEETFGWDVLGNDEVDFIYEKLSEE